MENTFDMKKILKNTLKEAKYIIGNTLMNDKEYFNKYYKDQKDKLEDYTLEELTRYFSRVYHAYYLEDGNELNEHQKEAKEKGIYLNWNLDRTEDVDINLPLLLKLLDKAGVIYEREHFYVGNDEISPTRRSYKIDRYATLSKREEMGMSKASLKDLLDESTIEEAKALH